MAHDRKSQLMIDRRGFLKYAGVSALTAGLAGCASDDAGSNGGDANGGDKSGNGGTAGTTNGSMDSSSVNEVILGSNHPLSGALASTGTAMHHAVELAARNKNDAGGIQSLGGAKVKVAKGNNKGKQELGGQVTQELIQEGAQVVLGCYSSPVTTAATQVAERQQTPFVITVAADDDILQGRGLDYVYRPQPPAQRMASDYATLVPKVIRQNGGTVETAGLFYVNNSYGQSITDHLHENLPKQNIEIVAETAISVGASSANTQVSKLKNADPDTIIATTYVPGGVTLVKALQNQNYRPPYLTACACATYTDENAIADIGSFANGIMDNNYALNPTIEKTARVKKQFRERYGQRMSASSGMAYVAGEVAIAGIEKAGTTDKQAINTALQNIKYEDHIAAMGPIQFKENGENKNALAPVNQVRNLNVKVVYPEQFAEVPPKV